MVASFWRPSTRSTAVSGIIVALILSSIGAGVGVGPAVGKPDTYAVTQGDQCWEIAPVGDGSQTVSSFYDYRAGPETRYSSYGTTELQESQLSQVFVYRGSEGDSLVVLHDQLNDDDRGGAATFTFSGLPSGGAWAVEDDQYASRDDRFQHSGTTSTIDWMWSPNRTDGAAFRGLDSSSYDAITVDPAFSEESWAAQGRDPAWPYAGDSLQWALRDGSGQTHTLDKSQPISISRGGCGESGPTASLSAPQSAAVGTSVTLDASGSNASAGISTYRWDANGDGTAEMTSDSAVVEYTYNRTGQVTPSVTVVDTNGQTDTASVTLNVTDSTSPEADADVPANVSVGESFSVSGQQSSDDGQITSYEWSFGDGTTATGETATHSYSSNGTYTVTLTVTDDAGNTDTAERTVTVQDARDTTPPEAVADVPTNVSVDESFTASGRNSSDGGRITSYEWSFGDGTTATGETATHSYSTNGTYTVSLTVTDEAGNTDSAERTVTVRAADGGGDSGGDGSGGDGSGDSGGDSGDGSTGGDGGGSDDGDSAGGSSGGGDSGGSAGGGGGGSFDRPETEVQRTDGGVVIATEDAADGREVEARLTDQSTAAGGVRLERVAYHPEQSSDRLAVTLETTTEAPADVASTSGAENAIAYVSTDRRPDRATFGDVDVTLGVRTDRLEELGATADDVVLYAADGGSWERLDARVTARGSEWVSVAASTDDLDDIALGVRRPLATAEDVSLNRSRVPASTPVEVTATVRNDGKVDGETNVRFTRDGELVTARAVTLDAGESTTVSFTTQFDSTGPHTVRVAGTQKNVTVVEPAARFEVTDVETAAETVAPNQQVEIRAVVENTGGKRGTYNASLTLFGDVAEVKRVTVPAGESKTVTFSRRMAAPGEYTASVGNESATIRVTEGGGGETPANPVTNGRRPEYTAAFVVVTLVGLGGLGRWWTRR
jgi:PKD repeat protein